MWEIGYFLNLKDFNNKNNNNSPRWLINRYLIDDFISKSYNSKKLKDARSFFLKGAYTKEFNKFDSTYDKYCLNIENIYTEKIELENLLCYKDENYTLRIKIDQISHQSYNILDMAFHNNNTKINLTRSKLNLYFDAENV